MTSDFVRQSAVMLVVLGVFAALALGSCGGPSVVSGTHSYMHQSDTGVRYMEWDGDGDSGVTGSYVYCRR